MGKLLQLIGLMILPLSLFYFGVFGNNLRMELFGLMIGSLCFAFGWKWEQSKK